MVIETNVPLGNTNVANTNISAFDNCTVTAVNSILLATSDTKKESIKKVLYPNPTSDILNIKSNSEIQSIEVFDISGRKMNTELNGHKVDVSHLSSGSYTIIITSKDGNVSEKFIKK